MTFNLAHAVSGCTQVCSPRLWGDDDATATAEVGERVAADFGQLMDQVSLLRSILTLDSDQGPHLQGSQLSRMPKSDEGPRLLQALPTLLRRSNSCVRVTSK